jgi:hypothetical protein
MIPDPFVSATGDASKRRGVLAPAIGAKPIFQYSI